jgi:hypothetical protein
LISVKIINEFNSGDFRFVCGAATKRKRVS